MINIFRYISTSIFLGLFTPCVYAALGLPENTSRIGYSLGVNRIQVNDPEGNTQAVFAVQPVKFIYTDWWKRGNRYWLELYYQQANLSANTANIGQQLQQSGLNYFVQKNYLLNDIFRPWVGAGVGVSIAQYQKRHSVDDEGYLLNTFPDRQQYLLDILFSVDNEWQVSKTSTFGGQFFQRIPVNGGITESLISVYYLVRY